MSEKVRIHSENALRQYDKAYHHYKLDKLLCSFRY